MYVYIYIYICIQNEKQNKHHLTFLYLFQIKSWPKYDAIGSHDRCELGKTTKDLKCQKLQLK